MGKADKGRNDQCESEVVRFYRVNERKGEDYLRCKY